MTGDRLEQYRHFVEHSPVSPDGYLFDQPRARFRPEPGDELVVVPAALRKTARGAELAYVQPLEILGIEFERLEAVFAELAEGPCQYSRLTILLGPEVDSFVEQTFGKVLFAPSAIAALEVEVPSLEIVRFAGSPYEVVRSYWRNMATVRRRLEADTTTYDAAALRALLLELHELALLGEPVGSEQRSSFYLPASALGRKRPTPGSFYEVPTGLERRAGEVILTGGARVSVPLLGSASYWQLIAESVSDEEALSNERQLELDGLPYGQVVQARAEDEAHSRPWFLPPRPLAELHFEELARDLNAATDAETARDLPALLAALGSFHFRFVRSHPLPSANQSLAMSLVNTRLRRLLGVGIPHLLLDQFALRFDLPAYQQLFARAVSVWNLPLLNASDRLRHLLRMRSELNDFVTELGKKPSLLEARALLPERGETRRLALL